MEGRTAFQQAGKVERLISLVSSRRVESKFSAYLTRLSPSRIPRQPSQKSLYERTRPLPPQSFFKRVVLSSSRSRFSLRPPSLLPTSIKAWPFCRSHNHLKVPKTRKTNTPPSFPIFLSSFLFSSLTPQTVSLTADGSSTSLAPTPRRGFLSLLLSSRVCLEKAKKKKVLVKTVRTDRPTDDPSSLLWPRRIGKERELFRWKADDGEEKHVRRSP